MRTTKEIKKLYQLGLEFDEHEISMFQATLGIISLPELVHKSFPEYKKDELQKLYDHLLAATKERR